MKKYQVELKWGIAFVLVALLWMYLEKALGWHDEHIDKHPMYTMIFMIPAIAIYVLALLEKRKSLGGTMSWKQGFIAGMIIAVIVAVFSPASQYVVHNLISPDYFQNAIDYSVSSGNSTQEKAEATFNFGSYVIQSVIGALVAGAITSAIVALILRKS